MSITKVIGVPWENIVKIGGIPKSSITNIGGVVVPPSVYCNTVEYGFSDGGTTPVTAACSASLGQYLEGSDGVLYLNGFCGDGLNVAPDGFYSDGRQIYLVSDGVLTTAGDCPTQSCVDSSYQFGFVPEMACSSNSNLYSFNMSTQQLYQFGFCDDISNYAPEGFYVDTFGNIYNWQETTMGWSWSFFGTCTPTPTCDDVSFSFGEAPGIACSAGSSFYSFDSANRLLYTFGSCGGDYAPEGFYSDGTVVYWWHTVGRDLVWETIGPCS